VIPQIEQFAQKHGVVLAQGWKVELAKSVKAAIASSKKDPLKDEQECLACWRRLFECLVGVATTPIAEPIF
jgi:hypothetical protein